MAAEIRAKYPDAEIELVPSRGGRFEVMRDGVPVFQKSKIGRHAAPGEIVDTLSRTLKRS